ncbi:uncharacterized protein B0I36DRAFT_360788 [Microdochium trichocladiopsis]|uniref:Uncharacterized protein n=1 Tax=Microdochium trichocladiopsis TaxID=1682393 RepID=A0A9P9BTA0_9PEZI|nr:uncharacterized protein B0I36DRAFT_360788 [Microdochium trichocladiopsis]KAH7035414.1 hypothetical protein B0I36DRAFT_360788 [Microdochium trichocladiopsis]
MPPPYSGPSHAALESHVQQQQQGAVPLGPQYYPGLPAIDYRQYLPPLFEMSTDTTTITSKASYLSQNPGALAGLVRTLAAVPPKPMITLQGKRGNKVDFNVKLNLFNLLVPRDPGLRMDYLRLVGSDEMAFRGGAQAALKPDLTSDGGLEEWCDRFCKDPATVKTFMLERVVANLDTNWLEGQLRSLVAATEYKGVVTVQFPITHAKVIVQNPDKVNKFFTSVTTLFAGKAKYEVVKAVWPFATARNGDSGRKVLVQSEKTWWEEWKEPIRYAVVTKRHGWITNEDKLEFIMEGKGRQMPGINWEEY